MHSFEYLAVPAPVKPQKVKGLKTPAERYAHELTALLNTLAAEGWEYWRADTLPSEERKGFRGTASYENHLLIFRRPSAEMLAESFAPAQDQGVLTTKAYQDRAPEPPVAPTIPPLKLDRTFEQRREPQFGTRRIEDE